MVLYLFPVVSITASTMVFLLNKTSFAQTAILRHIKTVVKKLNVILKTISINSSSGGFFV